MKLPKEDPLITQHIQNLTAVEGVLPGVFLIHKMPDFVVVYMSPNGLKLLGTTLEEVCALTADQYYKKYFNPADAEVLVPKIRHFMQQNKEDSVSYFQQVRFADEPDWIWHLTVTRILARDKKGVPLYTITTSHPIEAFEHISVKVDRLLEENEFLRANFVQFSKLSTRERDILRLQVLGLSSQEIADQLFIALTTVETHRRNIKRKLNASTSFELAQYARAFDLI